MNWNKIEKELNEVHTEDVKSHIPEYRLGGI